MKRYILLSLPVVAVLAGCAQSDNKSVDISSGTSYASSTVYSCDDGNDFIADISGSHATLSIASGPTVTLPQKRTKAGITYTNGSYEFRTKGHSAMLRQPGRRATNCMGLE